MVGSKDRVQKGKSIWLKLMEDELVLRKGATNLKPAAIEQVAELRGFYVKCGVCQPYCQPFSLGHSVDVNLSVHDLESDIN
jgi:hypothetical protein